MSDENVPSADHTARRKRAGRPRSESARQKVLKAAYELLEKDGIAAFSIDAVSSRSGVARTTIYRQWSSKGALAIESFLERFRAGLDHQVSSDPVQDFRALVSNLARTLSGPMGRVAASVVAEAQRDPETQVLFRELFSDPLREASAEVLRAGVETGALRRDLDVPRVLDAFVGAVYLRLLIGVALDTEWAESLSEMLLNGMRPPSARGEV